MTRLTLGSVATGFAALLPLCALAETKSCTAQLAGQETALFFEEEEVSFRSIWERVSPFAPECPSEAIMLALLPTLKAEERQDYCLLMDRQGENVLAVVKDKSDRFGRCQTEGAICRAVNGVKDFTWDMVKGGGQVLAESGVLAQAGVATAGKVGATVLAGTTTQILAGVGVAASEAGASALAVVSAPGVATGAAAGAVVIGGALLICGG